MKKDIIIRELKFKAVRGSGAGGQHVNKVSTKVELAFDVENSFALSVSEKERVYSKLDNRLAKDNKLILHCDDTRSQHKNREIATRRFLKLLESALKVQKKRKKTKPTKAAVEKRLESKRKAAEKKSHRKKPDLD